MQSPDYVTSSLPSRNTDGTNLSSQDSSPAKFMGAGVNNGVDNIPARFEEVSLSTIPNSSVEKEASGFSRDKGGRLTMQEYLSIGVLFLINLLNYMDRFTIAGVLPQIQTYFGLNEAMAGLLQTIFIVFFMVCAPMFGYIGDRFNRKYLMIGGLLVWISAVFASTFVPPNAFWAFVLLRGIVGVGEASYSITGPTIIADMFTSVIRTRVLMLFYFAIPVGSGLGFIIGSKVAALINDDWRWGVRVTPPLGLLCVLAIILIIKEPERGKAEGDQGAENVHNQPRGTYWQDVVYLLKNKTYVWSTIGYTAVVFVTGTLSWWTSVAVKYSMAADRNLTSIDALPSADKSNVDLIFGSIIILSGIAGVGIGTMFAQVWKRGQLCFRGRHNPRADAIWSVNVDMLLYIVLPNKRALATGFQILISHLFGDASGPYLIGLVSDWLRGGDNSPKAHFTSLIISFYIPVGLLVVSAIAFGISSWTLVSDKDSFDLAMGYKVHTGKITISGRGTGLDRTGAYSSKEA